MPADPQTHAIIGAAMEVHSILGHGFLEAVYQQALAEEFRHCGIPFEREHDIPITYKGVILNVSYRADFLCYDDVVVELKAIASLTTVDEAQLLNYLKGTGTRRGLLLNFGSPSLQYIRRVLGYANAQETTPTKSVESAKSVDRTSIRNGPP